MCLLSTYYLLHLEEDRPTLAFRYGDENQVHAGSQHTQAAAADTQWKCSILSMSIH